jgi:hypothetical protein
MLRKKRKSNQVKCSIKTTTGGKRVADRVGNKKHR